MDASNEFRFINTTQSCSGSSTSSTRRAKRNGDSSAHSVASSTNSLRTVPVCMYNENRSFKLRFFWDKAFKLFNSHRPVYRVESGVNYQDFGGTRGSSSNHGTLDNPSSLGTNGILVGGGGGVGPGLVKVRSQSHNQLNRLVKSSGNEADSFRGSHHSHSRNRRVVPTSSATTSRLLTTTTVTSGSSSETRKMSRMNGRHLYHNHPERGNVNLVGGGGGDAARNGAPSSSSSTSALASSQQQQHIEEQNFIPVVPARIRISGGEKPQREVDADGGSDKHSSFYYDDISGMYANAHSYQRAKKSSILSSNINATTRREATTGNGNGNPNHNIFSHCSTTANNSASSTVAPDQLRRSHSVKSHYSKEHSSSSPTGSAYQSWNSSSAGSSKQQQFYPDGDNNSLSISRRGAGSASGNSPCPCHISTERGGRRRPCCNYCNCEGSCQEGDESDTIGNDSGLDTWKKNSSAATTTNDSPSPRSSRTCEDPIIKGGNNSESGKTKPGIVCTISQRIPNYPPPNNYQRQQYIADDDDDEENDYATVASEEESEVEQGYNGMSRCGPSDNSDFVGISDTVDENTDSSMMIDNGNNVMYDSLDETYSVVPPVSSGNTTVVLINGCCQSDHCQNAPLSDTFNFSDYDVECMSEIDLNSEPGSGTGSNEESHQLQQQHINPGGEKGSAGVGLSGSGGDAGNNDMKFIICHSTSENELDSLDLAMFETNRAANSASSSNTVGVGGESCKVLFNGTSMLSSNNNSHSHNPEQYSHDHDDKADRNSSSFRESGGVSCSTIGAAGEREGDEDGCSQLVLVGCSKYGTHSSRASNTTTTSSVSIKSRMTSTMGNNQNEEIYSNWSDAGSEFEFLGPSVPTDAAPTNGLNRDIPMGHSPRGNPPEVEWEPYFCVLNQLDQTFTSYRSEEMSIFPGTPTRPRTQTDVFGDNGLSPTEIPRIRLDGGPNSIKCLINNAKWGMNPLMEEEEESNNTTGMASSSSNNGNGSKERDKFSGDYSSSSGSSRRQKTISDPNSPLDTSYDKACGSERRGSAPLTPLLGRETPSRFANFFSKRSFKSNPLKRTKSVTKLERKKAAGVIEPESSGGNILYPSRMRISRSHESLLAWTNNPVNSFVSNGMMSTMDLTAGDVSIRPLHPSILGQEHAFQVTTPTGSKYYTCSSAAERDSWVYAFRQAIRPRADEIRRRENSLKLWILEGKGIPGGSSGKHSSKRYFCELYLDDVLHARTCGKPRGDMLFWGEHFEFTQLPNCVQLITVVFFREGDKKRKKERNTCIGKVKIPVNSVTSRYLIEKWYPVLPDSSSKEKEHPSLRIKCKYQSVDILPLRCYKSFLQYVKDQYGPLSECLESVLSVKAKEDLASAMVHVLHHENLAKEFIAELALQEILKSGDEKLTFRGNSIATKAMEAFLKLTGTEYLHAALGPFIEQFQGSEELYDCEIDPMKLPPGANLLKNQQNLRMAVDTVWKAIMHSHSIFPIELRECFSHCREALKSAGKEELSHHLISASIFLRFLCPAILSPSLFNITNEYPSEKSARNLTLIAKVLQTLANFTRFQGKENYMEFINDFVEREASNMKAFLSCISSPLNPEAVKKAQKESRDKVPAGGFIDLGKYLSILSTLLSENVAKIAPKNDRFKHLQELLETIHKWLEQPANATNVAMFPFPHLPSPPPSGPPPPAPLGITMSHRFSNPLCNNTQAINHQYQIPHHTTNPTPIYAVSSVIHNNSNPNVKNISQVQMNMNGNCISSNNGNGAPPYPLQLQIPHVNPTQMGLNNPRSGSQASSGYQSQSPVLEGEDKANKKSSHIKDQINAHINNINLRACELQDATTALTFNNPVFNRKVGSQSVDDLSTVGVEKNDEASYPRRLARSSSSSDCEYTHSNISPTKSRARGQTKLYQSNNANISGQQSVHSKSGKPGHHRLSRRSSAELLRKNHPYSSSSDEDSDSGLVNERDEPTPHLPPRRNHIKRSSGHRPVPDGSSNGEKSLEEYEREMFELRRAMESLQAKLNRAEERLFGNESPGQNKRTKEGTNVGSPGNSGGGSGKGSHDRQSRSSDDGCKEVDQLLQRLLSAEEEMKREHDLLSALDKKQKLIEAQEQKIARLDSVNNQLLQALAQIRDSLQQQHVQQQQQKIQQQLLKQQQHLKNLANGFVPPCNHTVHQSSIASQNSLNNNGSLGNRPNRPNQLQLSHQPAHHDSARSNNLGTGTNNNNCNANTTKVLITSSSSESLSQATGDSTSDSISNNRDSSAILGEQALQMLAELRSSSC